MLFLACTCSFYPLLHPKKEYFVVIFLLVQSGNKIKICDLDFCNLMCFLFGKCSSSISYNYMQVSRVCTISCCVQYSSLFIFYLEVVAGSIKWESLLTMGERQNVFCLWSRNSKQDFVPSPNQGSLDLIEWKTTVAASSLKVKPVMF